VLDNCVENDAQLLLNNNNKIKSGLEKIQIPRDGIEGGLGLEESPIPLTKTSQML
jgi:hypothetical protein